MISIKKLIEDSNQGIQSFILLEDVECYIQLDDFTFEKVNGKHLKKGEVYDGEIIYKKNNQYYLDLGIDHKFRQKVFIPIISEKECVNLFWVKNNVEAVTFTPGNAYFLNTGFKHAVINYSDKDRYTFMITLNALGFAIGFIFPSFFVTNNFDMYEFQNGILNLFIT